jgi:UDP-N-acetylglucosamine 1-carboxyvinyltransferase
MLAAVKAEGQTILENAAKEPHIVDLANFLNSMGANIRGAGTDVIKIRGVDYLHGVTYSIIPDQIEAGTYMAAAAATRGRITVRNITPKHLESISSKLREMGCEIEEYDEAVIIDATQRPLNRVNIKTMPHPGFPTDCQPQFVALLSSVKGTSIVNESVWDNRYQYVSELVRMGAKISVEGRLAIIEGGKLTGAPVKATDLRAGAAMVIAALVAEGTTNISNIRYIERGYSDVVTKFQSLGADIKKIYVPDSEEAATTA